MAQKKAKKRNPWDIDKDELQKQKKENKAPTSGLVCPLRNKSIGGVCKGCDYIQTQIYARKYPEKHPAREWARQRKAKASLFVNVVTKENPETPLKLRLGSKVGSRIIDNAESEWTDILNPHKDKGREVRIKKVKGEGDYPDYVADVVLKKADWEVPEEVWKKKAHNLDQEELIRQIEANELTDEDYMDISSLNMGETFTFRILPPWQNGEMGEDNRRWVTFIWRHWGFTPGQLTGEDSISWKETPDEPEEKDIETDNDKPAPWESDSSDDEVSDETPQKAEKPKKKPRCFGKANFFEEDDELCQECEFFTACGKTVAKG